VTGVPEFEYQELLPIGPDDTPYRLLTTDGVSTFDTPEGRFVKVEPEALTLQTMAARIEKVGDPMQGMWRSPPSLRSRFEPLGLESPA